MRTLQNFSITIASHSSDFLRHQEIIRDAANQAASYAQKELKIDWKIDLVISDNLYNIIIPEDGVGARAYPSGNFILMGIKPTKINKDIISETVAHELCHEACFVRNKEKRHNLFDEIIFEGIATCFEAEFVKNRKHKQFFMETVLKRSDSENKQILEILREKLFTKSYDKGAIFYNGDNNLPRWAGYTLGYYLVKQYLAKTNKTIKKAFSDKYMEFRSVLKDIL